MMEQPVCFSVDGVPPSTELADLSVGQSQLVGTPSSKHNTINPTTPVNSPHSNIPAEENSLVSTYIPESNAESTENSPTASLVSPPTQLSVVVHPVQSILPPNSDQNIIDTLSLHSTGDQHSILNELKRYEWLLTALRLCGAFTSRVMSSWRQRLAISTSIALEIHEMKSFGRSHTDSSIAQHLGVSTDEFSQLRSTGNLQPNIGKVIREALINTHRDLLGLSKRTNFVSISNLYRINNTFRSLFHHLSTNKTNLEASLRILRSIHAANLDNRDENDESDLTSEPSSEIAPASPPTPITRETITPPPKDYTFKSHTDTSNILTASSPSTNQSIQSEEFVKQEGCAEAKNKQNLIQHEG